MSNEKNKLIQESEQLQAELAILKNEKEDLKSRTKQVIDQLKLLEEQINNFKVEPDEITVSDHAIVRYLERVENMDIESIKKKIVNEKASQLITKLGSGVFPVNDVFKITVSGKVVTTVLLNNQKTSLNSKKFSDR